MQREAQDKQPGRIHCCDRKTEQKCPEEGDFGDLLISEGHSHRRRGGRIVPLQNYRIIKTFLVIIQKDYKSDLERKTISVAHTYCPKFSPWLTSLPKGWIRRGKRRQHRACRIWSSGNNLPLPAESVCLGHEGAAFELPLEKTFAGLISTQRGSWTWLHILSWSWAGLGCFGYGNISPDVQELHNHGFKEPREVVSFSLYLICLLWDWSHHEK